MLISWTLGTRAAIDNGLLAVMERKLIGNSDVMCSSDVEMEYVGFELLKQDGLCCGGGLKLKKSNT